MTWVGTTAGASGVRLFDTISGEIHVQGRAWWWLMRWEEIRFCMQRIGQIIALANISWKPALPLLLHGFLAQVLEVQYKKGVTWFTLNLCACPLSRRNETFKSQTLFLTCTGISIMRRTGIFIFGAENRRDRHKWNQLLLRSSDCHRARSSNADAPHVIGRQSSEEEEQWHNYQ